VIASLGQSLLALAVVASALSIAASVGAMRTSSPRMFGVARLSLGAVALLFAGAAATLLVALLQSRFEIAYVVHYTERALPPGFKIAALWAGQEGSLLLWAVLLSVMSTIAVCTLPAGTLTQRSATVGVLALVCGFFATVLVFAADPFTLLASGAPMDGHGLNPMLQDPAMIAHPPLLFAGYAGFTIPFALLVGALTSKRTDRRWLAPARRWAMASWVFLSAGIALGAWWAYVELGWGGYWAWDPVENASLLPWLTGTALVHAIMVQQRRGAFKRWTASLIAVTFVLCIFGTYLTRSGVIQSVHAFGASVLGAFFLTFLAAVILSSLAMLAWRWNALAPEHRVDGLLSREGAFLIGCVLLSLMTATTLIGTIFPLISKFFIGREVTVSGPFYNHTVLPMALALIALMALGPALPFGKIPASRLVRTLSIPLTLAGAALLAALVMGVHSLWALSAIVIAVLGTCAVASDFARSVRSRSKNTGEFLALAALRLFDRDHRRYGGQLAHLGLMLIAVGVVASGLFSTDAIHRIKPADSISLGAQTLTLTSFQQTRGANFTAVEAIVDLADSNGVIKTLRPQRRYYDTWKDEANSEVAITTDWRRDLYLTLAGWEANGAIVAIEVRVNPGVVWIWIGSIILIIGGVYGVLPRLLPAARPAARASRTAPRSTDNAQNRKKALLAQPAPAMSHVSMEAAS